MGVHYHGASEALRAIVKHFGATLFERLPVFNDLTIQIIHNYQNASFKGLAFSTKKENCLYNLLLFLFRSNNCFEDTGGVRN